MSTPYDELISDAVATLTLQEAVTFFRSKLKDEYRNEYLRDRSEAEYLRELGTSISKPANTTEGVPYSKPIMTLFFPDAGTVGEMYVAMKHMAYICDTASSIQWSEDSLGQKAENLMSAATTNWSSLKDIAIHQRAHEAQRGTKERKVIGSMISFKLLPMRRILGSLAIMCAKEMEGAAPAE